VIDKKCQGSEDLSLSERGGDSWVSTQKAIDGGRMEGGQATEARKSSGCKTGTLCDKFGTGDGEGSGQMLQGNESRSNTQKLNF